MIVNVRAACGGGKSTLVRRIMGMHLNSTRITSGRRILGYHVGKRTTVLGNYEFRGMGGTDSIKNLDEVYALARRYAASGHVLFEGHADNDRTSRIHRLMSETDDSCVLYLSTSLEECEIHFRARYLRGGVRFGMPGPSDQTIERAVRRCHAHMTQDREWLATQFPGRVHHMSRDEAFFYLSKVMR